MSAWTTTDGTPKTSPLSSGMQTPDPVNSNEMPLGPGAGPSAPDSKPSTTVPLNPSVFHNPNGLTADQVGDGYRLLTRAEFVPFRLVPFRLVLGVDVEHYWSAEFNQWRPRPTLECGLHPDNTYRVRTVPAPLSVGDRVRLVSGPWLTENAVDAIGTVGTVVDVDGSCAPYLVERADGVKLWYRAGALVRLTEVEVAKPEPTEPDSPRKYRFDVGDRVVINGRTAAGEEQGLAGVVTGVVTEVDNPYLDGVPYYVTTDLGTRWCSESNLEFQHEAEPEPAEPSKPEPAEPAELPKPAPSIEDDPPDVFADEIPAQAKRSVYVSAHFPDAGQACRVAEVFRGSGHKVVSTWHDGDPGNGEEPAEAALRDFVQIESADALVMLGTPHRTTGGKFVELGFALGRDKRVFVLGARENWMLYHPSVKVFGTVEELITSGAL